MPTALRPNPSRRDAWLAFGTLFGVIGSHAILETARDALFLANVSAQRLPWLYVCLALVGFFISQGQRGTRRWISGGKAVSASIGSAGLITAVFYFIWPNLGELAYYALYLWTGVATSVLLVQFWMLMGELFTVTQAKKSFASVGIGGVSGAIAGSAAARALAEWFPPESLILTAAFGFSASALLPLGLTRLGATERSRQSELKPNETAVPSVFKGFVNIARYVGTQAYARGVTLLTVLSAVALTLGDYLFKSIVAREVPPEQLSMFFSTTYLVLNCGALVAQVLMVGSLKRSTLSIPLAVLPSLLLLSGVALVSFGGLVAAMLVKAPDGLLRHSLHRTTAELIYLPFTERVRARIKPFIDLVAQRSGQALASVAILVAVGLGFGERGLALMLIATCVLWLGGVVDLRRHYVDVFRGRLRQGEIGQEGFPELDTASLENLVAALDSEDSAQVVAALHILHRQGRTRLVPVVLLYHPDAQVVELTLRLFAATHRERALPTIDRILEGHASAHIRATALTARSVIQVDEQLLRERRQRDPAEEVKAAALINLIATGIVKGGFAQDALKLVLSEGGSATRIALADCVRWRSAQGFDETLGELLQDACVPVRIAALRAVAAVGGESLLPLVIDTVSEQSTRSHAVEAVKSYGQAGHAAVERLFQDERRDPGARWHLPWLLAQLDDHKRAADFLTRHLLTESSGMLRYRMIRSLQWLMKQEDAPPLNTQLLVQALEHNIARTYELLDQKRALLYGLRTVPERSTPGARLLLRSFDDRFENSLDRLFRLLELTHPNEDYATIHQRLWSEDPHQRANALELLRHVLSATYRDAVLALVEGAVEQDADPIHHLEQGARFYKSKRRAYEQLLEELLSSRSRAVQAMAVYHIGELKLHGMASRIAQMKVSAFTQADVELTKQLLTSQTQNRAKDERSFKEVTPLAPKSTLA